MSRAEPAPGRRPKNEAEGLFWDKVKEDGWEVTKRGWPDFFCTRQNGDLMLVEVKAHRGRRLKHHQIKVLKILGSYGVPCYRWSPDTGLERVPMARRL